MKGKYYSEAQKRYYQKHADKIKERSKARYHANKKKMEESRVLVAQLNWDITRLEKLTNILAFTAAINAASLIFLAFFH